MTTATAEIPCLVVTNHSRAAGNRIRWTAKAERVHDDVMVVRNAIPFIDELPALAEKYSASFVKASVIGPDNHEYSKPEHRNSDRLVLGTPGVPDGLALYSMLCETAEPHYITAYHRLVNKHAEVSRGSGYDLLRYREGGFFKEHVDVARDHPVLGHRRLAVVAFCNNNFEGGELHFPRQNLTIKPEPGLIAMFPATFTHPHESKTISKGTKYSIVTWFH